MFVQCINQKMKLKVVMELHTQTQLEEVVVQLLALLPELQLFQSMHFL